jgi:hypothetical protein
MRPRGECGIADQHGPAEHQLGLSRS